MDRAEADFLATLGGFLKTPREAKRMVNLYRLLKVSIGSADARQLKSGQPPEYQAAMVLLAALSGFPRQGAELLRALAETTKERWFDFLAEIRQAHVGPAVDLSAQADLRAWFELTQALDEVAARQPSFWVEPFKRWAKFVARYAFWGGPRLTEGPTPQTKKAPAKST